MTFTNKILFSRILEPPHESKYIFVAFIWQCINLLKETIIKIVKKKDKNKLIRTKQEFSFRYVYATNNDE